MSEKNMITAEDYQRAGYFCWIEARPDDLPWFIAHVERHARREQWSPPAAIDVGIRAKWIMLDKGLAATGHLVAECEKSKGKYTSPVREYRLPTAEETTEALTEAFLQLYVEANLPRDSEGRLRI